MVEGGERGRCKQKKQGQSAKKACVKTARSYLYPESKEQVKLAWELVARQ